MAVEIGGYFANELKHLIVTQDLRCVVETGTYLGEGSTKAFVDALRTVKEKTKKNVRLFCIESNNDYAEQVKAKYEDVDFLTMLEGLSLSRGHVANMTVSKIEALYKDSLALNRHIAYDYEGRWDKYCDESFKNYFTGKDCLLDSPWEEIDILKDRVIRAYESAGEEYTETQIVNEFPYPELVLLDSAGHLGFSEANHLLSLLPMYYQSKERLYIALDDVSHLKHCKSYHLFRENPKMKEIFFTHERYGACIFEYTG